MWELGPHMTSSVRSSIPMLMYCISIYALAMYKLTAHSHCFYLHSIAVRSIKICIQHKIPAFDPNENIDSPPLQRFNLHMTSIHPPISPSSD
jgi:hypothetical protein